MDKAIKSDLLHFTAGTRLQCPNCLLVSNNHGYFDFGEFIYDSGSEYSRGRKYFANYHFCHNCGTTDAPYLHDGSVDFSKCNKQFIDSGNYESWNFNPSEMSRSEKKIKDLEEELEYHKEIIRKGNEEFENLWHTEEDRK